MADINQTQPPVSFSPPSPSGMAETPQPAQFTPPAAPLAPLGSVPQTQQPLNIANAPLSDDLSVQWRRTKCMVCGYIHEGRNVMTVCPRCKNADPDKFVESD